MTDKKFTDEEIIKAIKNLFKNTDGRYELTIQNSTKGVCGEEQEYQMAVFAIACIIGENQLEVSYGNT